MTAVAPIDTYQQECRRRTVDKVLDANGDAMPDSEDKECDEQPSMDCLSKLLISMRLSGLYFKWPIDKPSSNSGMSSRKTILLEKLSFVHSTIVLAILWINVLRLWTMFYTREALLQSYIFKSAVMMWTVQCAIQHAVYYVACRTGKLDDVLKGIRLRTSDSVKVGLVAVRITAIAWFCIAVFLVFFVYGIFFSGDLNSYWLAPFGSYLLVYDITTVRIVSFMMGLPAYPAYCFPVVMTFILAKAFSIQFRGVTRRLRHAINNISDGSGISDIEVEEIRRQHQTLCFQVKRADRFLRFYHIAAFFGPIVMTIILLYTLIFSLWLTDYNTLAIFTVVYFLIGSLSVLSLTVGGGIMVNYYAHKIRLRIHNINLSVLSSKTIGKISVFLERTSGDPVGFSVIGIVVITKTTIISLTGLLITYFLLIVQLSKPSGGGTTLASKPNVTGSSE